MSQLIKVAAVSQLRPGTMRVIEANGHRLLLIDIGGEIHALDARCPHRGGPLEEGDLRQGMIECPWHHYRYDVRTGENLYPRNVYPADIVALQRDLRPIRRYTVQIIDEQIWVEV